MLLGRLGEVDVKKTMLLNLYITVAMETTVLVS